MVRQSGRSNNPTTPENFPTQAPLPSGDYSYTVEIVMQMQQTLGRLLEAVESLKTDSREQRTALNDLGKDVHGYKTGIKWAIGICLAVGSVIGWAVGTYISAHAK